MPLPGTPHCAKIAVQWTYVGEGNKCENVFYLMDPSDAIFVDPTLTANLVWTAVLAHLVPTTAPQILYDGVGFEDVRTFPFGGISVPQTATPGSNGATGTPIPASNSLAIKKSTATLGRSGRGRWYFPIGNAQLLSGGNSVTPAVALGFASGLADFQTAVELSLSPAQVGLVSYFSGGTQRIVGLFSQILSWAATDLAVDSQRRRLIGRGQ